MSKEMVSLPRENIYVIFMESYKTIAKDIEQFFGPEDDIDKELLKEYRTFKELMINSVDNIHKQLLLENIKYEEEQKAKKKKEQEKEEPEEEEKKEKGFWD